MTDRRRGVVRAAWCAALCVAVAALLAACGSSSGDSGSTSGAGASGAGTSDTTASGGGASTTAAKPTGKPIVVYSVTDASGIPFSPALQQFHVAAKAAADYVNEQLGGVDGRPIKVVTCDSKADPAATAACASQAVQDDAVATTGLANLWPDNGLQIVAKAGIPSMNTAAGPQQFISKDSFPISGGSGSEYPAQVEYWATRMGAKSAVWLSVDAPSLRASYLTAKKTADSVGMKMSAVFTPATQPDPTSGVAKAVSLKPDVILSPTAGPAAVIQYRAFQQQGWPPTKLVATGGAVDNDAFFDKADQASIEGSYYSDAFVSYDDLSDKEVAAYRGAMKKHANAAGRSSFAQESFADVMTIYGAGKQIGGDKLDAASLHAFLTNVEGFHVFMGGTLSRSSAPKQYPALFNPFVGIVQYKGGKVVTVAPFFDPFTSNG